MKDKLSLIVPCFNSATTLDRAVRSIYSHPPALSYEVIFVDDGSTDKTWKLIQGICQKYPHAKKIQHEHNQGGGAARNTGIRIARGNLILCLDSDNFFAPDTIQKLLTTYVDRKVDGVVIHKRRYFYRTPLISTTHVNPITRDGLTLADLFNGKNYVLDNFLFTRDAYAQSGGYPEQHGFDTQGFEVRFLAQGFRTVVAPESLIYHRQGDRRYSYFERVYEAGEMSKNLFLMYEEILPRFSGKIQEKILAYDIYAHTSMTENLHAFLVKEFKRDPKNFFCENKTASSESVGLYLQALEALRQKKHNRSMQICTQLLHREPSWKTPYFLWLRNLSQIRGVPQSALQTTLQPVRQVSMFRQNLVMIGVNKIGRLFS